MTSAKLTVRDDLGDASVQPTTLGNRVLPSSGRGDQRVRHTHVVAVDDEHSRLDGCRERALASERGELAEAQIGAQRDHRQDRSRRIGKLRSASEQLLDTLWAREARRRSTARRPRRASVRPQCEQRIAERRVVDTPHHLT